MGKKKVTKPNLGSLSSNNVYTSGLIRKKVINFLCIRTYLIKNY